MSPAFVLLHHGTTRHRADRMVRTGPDATFVEPGGGLGSRAEGFSTVEAGATDRGLGTAEDYARRKAGNFPTEGGPVILEVDVPVGIVELVQADPIGAIVAASGEIRFEPGLGLEELLQAWPGLTKRVIVL
jgi:hypothetical protein